MAQYYDFDDQEPDVCLTRSCCEVTTPQLHRHTGAVGYCLNYPRTEYGAPTSSSLRNRTGTIADFESRRHVPRSSHLQHMTRTSMPNHVHDTRGGRRCKYTDFVSVRYIFR